MRKNIIKIILIFMVLLFFVCCKKKDYSFYTSNEYISDGNYLETDYGHTSRYVCGGVEQFPYVVVNKIIRGTCRFVFVDGSYEKNIVKRPMFYTYNYYNDFEEYLNYDKGYSKIFGNETAGNKYIYDSDDAKKWFCRTN